jgi:hypothetical protein
VIWLIANENSWSEQSFPSDGGHYNRVRLVVVDLEAAVRAERRRGLVLVSMNGGKVGVG